MALPKIGLSAVLENATGFNKALETVNKNIADASAKTKDATKSATPFSSALDKVGISVDAIKEKIAKFTGINQEAIDGIFELAGSFGPLGIAIGVTVIAVAALAAGFLALANRGAPLQELAIAFDNITASVGLTSQALLTDLRKASNGMVDDFGLIKIANTALLGETGKLGIALGKDLPKLMEIARVASDATGKSLDETFNTLVEGVKKGAARQLKSVGIVLNATTANEEYAKSIGKSVASLTDEEKRVALLNATLEKGQLVLDQNANAIESNADKMDRSQATITNIFDTLAVAVQPAFATVLDIANRVLGGFQQLATGLAPILGAVASVITDILGGAVSGILDILQPIFDALVSFLPYISILFQGIANIIHGAVTVIGNVIGGVVHFLQDVGSKLFGLDISNLGKSLFEGAAKAFGAFANGILAVANQLIFPAVIGIAKFIADFLIGFSPPKKGPLSMIDKGGENIMKAWLDGITGVSLDPVDKVAAEVSAALGDIGKATAPQVDARLKELDQALLPFQNRLDIVKSQFDAIAEPAKAALDSIDRQVAAAQEALAGGDQAAADTIRRLDAAREAIQGQLDAQQAVVDQQQIQLGLATAAQAQERALLNIRKAQLTVTSKTAAAAKTVAGGAKEPKAPAGSTPVNQDAGASGGLAGPTGPSAIDLIGGQSAVNDAIGGIQDAFASQIDTSQLDLFGTNSSALQDQLSKIGSVDIGSKLKDKFKGLTDLFDTGVDGSPAQVISNFFSPDAKTPGSLASFVDTAGATLNNLGPSLQAAAPGIKDQINAALGSIFDPNVDGSVAQTVTLLVQNLTGDENAANSIASYFATLPANAANAASGLLDSLQTTVFTPVTNFLTGSEPGSLSDVLNGVVQFFTDLPSRVTLALSGLAGVIYAALVVPVITAVNSLIGAVEGAIRTFVQGIATFIASIADGIDSVGLGIDTSGIHNISADLGAKAAGITLGRIPIVVPQLTVPAAAAGGLFGPGAINVGERGPERIFAASKVGILPAALTKALDGLGSIMAQPSPMNVPAGNTYNESSSSYTFNGVQSDNDARRRYNALRAGMR